MKQISKLRIFERIVIMITVLVIILGFTLPYYSIRLSLITHGHPFAKVVATENLNVFDYVPMDNFRAGAIAFANGKAIGWIYNPLSGVPRYVPFSKTPSFDLDGFDPIYDFGDMFLLVLRWPCLLACTIVLLFREFRKQRVSHAGTNI